MSHWQLHGPPILVALRVQFPPASPSAVALAGSPPESGKAIALHWPPLLGSPPEAGKVTGRNLPSLAVFLSLAGLAAPSSQSGQACQLQGQTFAA